MKIEKKLLNNIKQEGNAIVPDVLSNVYKQLKIDTLSLSEEELKIEDQLKHEGQHFISDSKNRVYILANIEKKEINPHNAVIKAKMHLEKNIFVPDVKKEVYKNLRLKQSFNLLSWIKKPRSLAFISAGLVVAIAVGTTILYRSSLSSNYSLIGNLSLTGTTQTNGGTSGFTDLGSQNTSTFNPKPNEISLLKVEVVSPDASATKIGPLFSYNVTTDGKVDNKNIVKNETASYIIKSQNIAEYNNYADQFILDMLNGSLSEGYLYSNSQKGIGLVNVTVTTLDNDYLKNIEDRLGYLFYNFACGNRAYVTYNIINNDGSEKTELQDYLDNKELNSDDQEKVGLIYNIYDALQTIKRDAENFKKPNPYINQDKISFSQYVDLLLNESKDNLLYMFALLGKLSGKGYNPQDKYMISYILIEDIKDTHSLARFIDQYKYLLNDENANNQIDNDPYTYFALEKKHAPYFANNNNEYEEDKDYYGIYDFYLTDEEIKQITDVDKLYLTIKTYIGEYWIYPNTSILLTNYSSALETGQFAGDGGSYNQSDDYKDDHNHGSGRRDDDWSDEDEAEYGDWFEHQYGDNPWHH